MSVIGPYSISNLPAVYFDGEWRILGCIPETEESKADFPVFGQSMAAPLDPSQWRDIDLSWYEPVVKNQSTTSSCAGHACASGLEVCWMQSGRSKIEFNPFFVYGLINNGVDRGAMLSDGLRAMQKYGVCLKDDLPRGVMFKNQFPQSAYDSAARYKLINAYRCNTFEEICSAITLGYVTPLGIYVGDNFANVDAEGVAPLPAGGGGGHAILGVGLKKSSRYGWLIKFLNSWGNRYAIGGYGYIRKEHFRSMSPDAFAVQMVSTQEENSIPPIIN